MTETQFLLKAKSMKVKVFILEHNYVIPFITFPTMLYQNLLGEKYIYRFGARKLPYVNSNP